jgi:hypothetical protein
VALRAPPERAELRAPEVTAAPRVVLREVLGVQPAAPLARLAVSAARRAAAAPEARPARPTAARRVRAEPRAAQR